MSTHLEKWIISVVSGILFFFVAHPKAYSLVQKLVQKTPLGSRLTIANDDGCPSNPGVFVHSIVFTLLVALTMYVSEWAKKYSDKDSKPKPEPEQTNQ